jgi:hypothetical protein
MLESFELRVRLGGMLRLLSVLLLVVVGTTGCKDARPNEITGTWIMRDGSRQILPPELKETQAKIILASDGTFTASDLPGLFYVPDHHPLKLESGTGVWKLAIRDGTQQLFLEFRTIRDWNENLPYGTHLDISRGLHGIHLDYSIDDPDEGRTVEFEKVH